MAFIRTIPPDQAEGKLKDIYEHEQQVFHYVASGTISVSLRPEVFEAWEQLLKTIRVKMRLRRFELVTIAAAGALHCTYCLLAHGAVLRRSVFSAEQLEAIVTDYHNAGLEPQEVVLMEFAEKLTLHAHAIRADDVDGLRKHGLTDEEILDVILAASARNFWSKVMDATGTEADLQYLDLEPNVRKAMQKGRPFAEDRVCPVCFGTHIIKKVRTADGREEYYCPACAKGGVLKPRNKYSEAQKLQILEHYERYSAAGIKKTFGVSKATLARWEKARNKRTRANNKPQPPPAESQPPGV